MPLALILAEPVPGRIRNATFSHPGRSFHGAGRARSACSILAAGRSGNSLVKRPIAALPDWQGTVLLELLGREDYSYLDISRRLGLPVGTIGPTWQRAVTRVRRDPGWPM